MDKALALNRRQLLAALITGSTLVSSQILSRHAKAEPDKVLDSKQPKNGYKETQHIRAYYASLK